MKSKEFTVNYKIGEQHLFRIKIQEKDFHFPQYSYILILNKTEMLFLNYSNKANKNILNNIL